MRAADKVFTALAEGGVVELPMRNCFWQAYFGIVTDQFGVKWMVGFLTGSSHARAFREVLIRCIQVMSN